MFCLLIITNKYEDCLISRSTTTIEYALFTLWLDSHTLSIFNLYNLCLKPSVNVVFISLFLDIEMNFKEK